MRVRHKECFYEAVHVPSNSLRGRTCFTIVDLQGRPVIRQGVQS